MVFVHTKLCYLFDYMKILMIYLCYTCYLFVYEDNHDLSMLHELFICNTAICIQFINNAMNQHDNQSWLKQYLLIRVQAVNVFY